MQAEGRRLPRQKLRFGTSNCRPPAFRSRCSHANFRQVQRVQPAIVLQETRQGVPLYRLVLYELYIRGVRGVWCGLITCIRPIACKCAAQCQECQHVLRIPLHIAIFRCGACNHVNAATEASAQVGICCGCAGFLSPRRRSDCTQSAMFCRRSHSSRIFFLMCLDR